MRGIQSQFTSLRSFLAREPLGELLRFPWLQSASEVACLVQQRGVKKQANEVGAHSVGEGQVPCRRAPAVSLQMAHACPAPLPAHRSSLPNTAA